MPNGPGDALPIRLLNSPEARRLADLIGVMRDLEFVANAADQIAALLESGDNQAIVIDALHTAALVAYVRCFAHGKRVALSVDRIKALDNGEPEYHEYLKNMRDKHLAHAVNPFEKVAIGVVLKPEDEGSSVVGISALALRHIGPDLDGARQLARYARRLLTMVRPDYECLQESVQRLAAQLTPAELDRLPRARVTGADPNQAGSTRAD